MFLKVVWKQDSKNFRPKKKFQNLVLKGVSYIGWWKFYKSQDAENSLSPEILKNFQQQTVEFILLVARSQELKFISSPKICAQRCYLYRMVKIF